MDELFAVVEDKSSRTKFQFAMIRGEMQAGFARMAGERNEKTNSRSSERIVIERGKRVIGEGTVQGAREGDEMRIDSYGMSQPRETPWVHLCLMKLDMPIFNGEISNDPDGWIRRVERYFPINRLPEKEKVEAAELCFEGESLNWHH